MAFLHLITTTLGLHGDGILFANQQHLTLGYLFHVPYRPLSDLP
jgi:hypothetical protein